MGYADRRVIGEFVGIAILAAGLAGVYMSFSLGFSNIPSATCWILSLIAFGVFRDLDGYGLWSARAGLIIAHAVGAMCVLYALAGVFLSPAALLQLAVYAPKDPSQLIGSAFFFEVTYVMPGVIWLRRFLECE